MTICSKPVGEVLSQLTERCLAGPYRSFMAALPTHSQPFNAFPAVLNSGHSLM